MVYITTKCSIRFILTKNLLLVKNILTKFPKFAIFVDENDYYGGIIHHEQD